MPAEGSPIYILYKAYGVSSTEDSPRYLTASQLRAWPVRGAALDYGSYSDADLITEIVIAESLVDRYCGTYFDSREGTLYLNGTGNHYLPIHPYISAPLISTTTLKLLDTDGVTALQTLTENTDFFANPWSLEKPLDRFRNSAANNGRDDRSHWIRGYRRYELMGTFGSSLVPANVKKAVAFLAMESLFPGTTGMEKSGVYMRRWEDYMEQLAVGSSPALRPGETTGFDLTDRILEGYLVNPSLFIDLSGDFSGELPDPSPVTDFGTGMSIQ